MEITCYWWRMMLDSSVIFTSPAAKRFPNTGVNITNTEQLSSGEGAADHFCQDTHRT